MNNVHPELVTFPDFPENDEYYCGLPDTLSDLYIEGLENLESLSSKGLQNLTSLKEHHISKCARLQPLPKDGLLAMLSRLEIEDCPLLKIKFFRPTCGSQDGIDQRLSSVFSIRSLQFTIHEVIFLLVVIAGVAFHFAGILICIT
ncbi:hypothetical protein F0562_014471 [Nyssa sinensis]|uniref:Uncharacterized protein n=1 Tax=Nyssa sinensis TaxID=561372 RepID=A0A5J4ZNJ2_9ASTE|nr:hypothetical protein F0562_014471 [Nyssa sinensis]